VRCGRCGSENNEGNRFCGMCGAELVTRTPSAASVPAPNAPLQRPQQPAAGPKVDTNRPVDRSQFDPRALSRPSPEPGGWSRRHRWHKRLRQSSGSQLKQQSAIAQPSEVPPSRTERIVYDPGISGPSFLGLNQPTPRRTWEPAETERESRHDSSLHSSGSVDYLLEDEEEPGRGWGKLALVVIALALLQDWILTMEAGWI